MKKTLVILAFLLVAAPAALLGHEAKAESVPGDFGNTSGTPDSSSGIGIKGGTGNGTANAIKQRFTVNSQTTPDLLYIPIWKELSDTSTITLKICPEWDHPDDPDPCENFPLASDAIASSTLPDSRAAAFASPYHLELADVTFYPGITYVITIARASNSGGNFSRIAYTATGYADGELFNKLNGCSPTWVLSSNASSCGDTTWQDYDIFFGFTTFGSDLTIDLYSNGPQVTASGFCIEPEDLPGGWILSSNVVSLLWRDTSASGTFILSQPDCSNGAYIDSQNLWNATYAVEAQQQGDPVDFTASATITVNVANNPYRNPLDTLGISQCGEFSILNALDDNVWPCYARAFVSNVLTFPPFSWYWQVRSAILTESTTTTQNVTLTVPAMGGFGGASIPLFATNSTSTGIVGELNSVGTIGGNTWYEWFELALWLGFIGYAVWRMTTIFDEV